MKYFRILAITCLLTWVNGWAVAQDTIRLDWSDLHYLSEEEMLSGERSVLFNETNPPAGDYVRFPAEFEPMQAVTIRYPLGIPLSLVKQLSQRTKVYVIVKQSLQSTAHNKFQQAGCKMSNIFYFNMTTDSYWVRDYGPWYIFNDLQPAIVDNVYNRPRQYDNMVPVNMGQLLGLPVYGMNLTHTGGNMMEDGRGIGVSDELVLTENGNNATNVRNKMNNYLGVDPYHITIDPQGYYIAHVDCWGKFLAPDKILIARLPQSNIQYDEYESVANFFANTNCCWGYPYKVYRVDEPGGYVLAPYTNSLIVNKTVFVPLGTNTTYNNNALAVYREAMPGYEVIGVASSSDYPWKNTDALHCRARGVMDFNMLFVDHRDVIHGEVPMQDSIAITSKFIAYSGANLKQDSLLVYYSIDGGAYQTAKMRATGNPYEYVGYIKGYYTGSSVDYYVFGADQSGHRYTQPSFGALDPHHFVISGNANYVMQNINLSAGWNWWSPIVNISVEEFEAALGTHGIFINSQGLGFARYENGCWNGTLVDFVPGKMYKIQTNASCNFSLSGNYIPVCVNIVPGNNWFGYTGLHAATITEAFDGFVPTEGDRINSQGEGYTVYHNGAWSGTLSTLLPGHGYIYISNSTERKTLRF